MPVVIGAEGVERIVEIELNGDEKAMFDKSARGGAARWSTPASKIAPELGLKPTMHVAASQRLEAT